MLFIWFLSFILLYFVVFKILLKMTVHRGLIHSVPIGLLFSQCLSISLFHFLHFEELFSILCGIFLFFGFIIHLLLDELISLNAFGMSFKKSLGSAFKFYEKNNIIGSIFTYILIILLYVVYPINLEYFFEISKSFQNINL